MSWDRYRLIAIPEIAAGIGLVAGIWYRGLAIVAGFGLVLLMIGAAIFRTRAKDDKRNVIIDVVLAAFAAIVTIVQILAL